MTTAEKQSISDVITELTELSSKLYDSEQEAMGAINHTLADKAALLDKIKQQAALPSTEQINALAQYDNLVTAYTASIDGIKKRRDDNAAALRKARAIQGSQTQTRARAELHGTREALVVAVGGIVEQAAAFLAAKGVSSGHIDQSQEAELIKKFFSNFGLAQELKDHVRLKRRALGDAFA